MAKKRYMGSYRRFADGGQMPPDAGGGQGAPPPDGGGGAPAGPGGMPTAPDPSAGGGDPMQQLDGLVSQFEQNPSPELAMQGMQLLVAIKNGGQGGQGAPGQGAPMSSDMSGGGGGAGPSDGGGGGGQPAFKKGGKMPFGKKAFGKKKPMTEDKSDGKFRAKMPTK